MLGLSRTERHFCIAFPLILIAASAVLLILDTTTQRSSLSCFTPSHFTGPQSNYCTNVCSTSADQRNSKRSPGHLAVIAVLLLIPVFAGDLLRRIADVLSPQPIEGRVIVVRCVLLLVSRLLLLIFYTIGAALLSRSLGETDNLSPWGAVRELLEPRTSLPVVALREPAVILCDCSFKSMGRVSRFRIECIKKSDPLVPAVRVSRLVAWLMSVAAVLWILLGLLEMAALLAHPWSRKNLLAKTVRDDKTEDTELQQRDNKTEGEEGKRWRQLTED